MPTPHWYARRYPTLYDLQTYAQNLGALVRFAPIGDLALYIAGEGEEPPVILLPEGQGPLLIHWLLAHELGHVALHAGPRGELLYDKDERAADRWAACALIPEAAVRRHKNASLDAFIGALSAHFEDIPMRDCPQRRLAAHIAMIRLRAVREVA